MRRIEKLEKMKHDPHWQLKILRLGTEELDIIEKFLEINEPLDFNEFAELVNRMFLSSHGLAPTQHAGLVQEILHALEKTKMGFYGYHGTKRWVHPLDRKNHAGKEWVMVDETEPALEKKGPKK
jgi:hypothetical protein